MSSYGVMRGLHFQRPPFTQSRLVRCVKGRVLEVAVDIRKGSPTYGKHVAVELTEDNHRQFFIPKGFAHGFAVLSEALFLAVTTQIRHTNHIFTTQTITNGKKKRKNRPLRGVS